MCWLYGLSNGYIIYSFANTAGLQQLEQTQLLLDLDHRFRAVQQVKRDLGICKRNLDNLREQILKMQKNVNFLKIGQVPFEVDKLIIRKVFSTRRLTQVCLITTKSSVVC